MKTRLPLLFALATCSAQAHWLDGDYLTGDWQGERTALAEKGVTVFGYYNAIYAGNVSGGHSTDSSYAGDLYAGTKIDFGKWLGWNPLVFTLSGIDRHGRSIDEAVGGQYSVMQLVGGQSGFLYEMNLEAKFLDDTLAIKLGRMSATDDFVGSPYYSYSLNNAVNGQIRAALFDGVMTSYPFPVWGGRLKYQPNEEFNAMLGVYQLSDDMFDRTDRGVDFSIEGDDGVSVFTQVGWNPKFADRPAHFYAGINQAFKELTHFNDTDTSNYFIRYYAHADYQVYSEGRGSKEGLVAFATFAYTDQQDIAIIPIQSTLGLNYQGLLPDRPDDNTVFFMTYGQFSNDYAASKEATGDHAPDYEMVLEAGHRFQMTKFSYIQPDVQYIVHPAGNASTENALVLGVQYGLTF
jgi:porin